MQQIRVLCLKCFSVVLAVEELAKAVEDNEESKILRVVNRE